jgi:hypothetical protein
VNALPLGRAVQHTGEMSAANPLDCVWIFGAPTRRLAGYAQVRIDDDRGSGYTVRASLNVDVQVFGDAAHVNVLPL